MTKRFNVVSGEFRLVMKRDTLEEAALDSIRLHFESDHHSCLGVITMVESKKEAKFFSTQNLIDSIYNSNAVHAINSKF